MEDIDGNTSLPRRVIDFNMHYKLFKKIAKRYYTSTDDY